jgi:hypothetical protein
MGDFYSLLTKCLLVAFAWGAFVCIIGRIEIRHSYDARHAAWLEEKH